MIVCFVYVQVIVADRNYLLSFLIVCAVLHPAKIWCLTNPLSSVLRQVDSVDFPCVVVTDTKRV